MKSLEGVSDFSPVLVMERVTEGKSCKSRVRRKDMFEGTPPLLTGQSTRPASVQGWLGESRSVRSEDLIAKPRMASEADFPSRLAAGWVWRGQQNQTGCRRNCSGESVP